MLSVRPFDSLVLPASNHFLAFKAWENWFFASNLLVLINLFTWDSGWKTFGGPLLKKWNEGKKTIYGEPARLSRESLC